MFGASLRNDFFVDVEQIKNLLYSVYLIFINLDEMSFNVEDKLYND